MWRLALSQVARCAPVHRMAAGLPATAAQLLVVGGRLEAGSALASKGALNNIMPAASCGMFHTSSFAAEAAEAQPVETPETENNQTPEMAEGAVQPHPGIQRTATQPEAASYMLMHPVYKPEYLTSVKPQHRPPTKAHEKAGYWAVQALRRVFDWATGYGHTMTERQWLRRFIFLETVAGVPGMVGGMLRHMRSLRSMKRDNGWIHTLLEEAENERMHLLTFLQLRQPGFAFRTAVLAGQGVFFNSYLLAYIVWPKACHSFVGYLEEEAVKTYTRAIQDVDSAGGALRAWAGRPAPEIALNYWRLPRGATLRDVLLNVRADEACHMHVNHTFSDLPKDQANPFEPGSVHVP